MALRSLIDAQKLAGCREGRWLVWRWFVADLSSSFCFFAPSLWDQAVRISFPLLVTRSRYSRWPCTMISSDASRSSSRLSIRRAGGRDAGAAAQDAPEVSAAASCAE
jgi:hypothetical protein